MRRPILLLLAASVVSVTIVALVVVLDPSGGEPDPARDETFATTPLRDLDTTGLAVARAGFCAAVDPREVSAALGGDATSSSGYDNGDEVGLPDGSTDVAHEFGCSWSLDDGSEARAWVFAPPVDGERAARLLAEARRSGCAVLGEEPAYGEPSIALLCHDEAPLTFVSYRGLFGDAWVTCELGEEPREAIDAFVARVGAWCGAVARAASG